MRIVPVQLTVPEGSLNALMSIRRAEVRGWGYPAINIGDESNLISQGLVRIVMGGTETVLTDIGRLVLDSLGKESVCAQ